MMNAPRVFISFSHESAEHEGRVLALSNRLRQDGIDCRIDLYESSPAQGWPMWMEEHLIESDFVLMVCTKTYLERLRAKQISGRGLGVRWESVQAYTLIYNQATQNQKFIPCLFAEADRAHIPSALGSYTPYVLEGDYALDRDCGYQELYRRLTNQHRTPMPALGALQVLLPQTPLPVAPQPVQAEPVKPEVEPLADNRPRAVPDAVWYFDFDRLELRMAGSRKVRMLLLRNSTWFTQQKDNLAKRLAGDFELEILLPDPSNPKLMEQLVPMFQGLKAEALAASIRKVIGTLLEIRAGLATPAKLRIRVHSFFPPYSAYLFDDEELWYIPYLRSAGVKLPVFEYRGRLSQLEVYKDLVKLAATLIGSPSWMSLLVSHALDRVDALTRAHPECAEWLGILRASGAPAVIFGGFVRDCIHSFVHQVAAVSRDLDFVIDGAVPPEIVTAKRNHFDGARWLTSSGLSADCWPLASTFAFKHGIVAPPTLAKLNETTVYRLNGCYLPLDDEKIVGDYAIADVYSRRIVFNCREYLHEYSQYQAFRAAELALRLDYELDGEVDAFVRNTATQTQKSLLVSEVQKHRSELTHADIDAVMDHYR